MLKIQPPAKTKKDKLKKQSERAQGIRKSENPLRAQKKLTCQQTRRARKWKRQCKRARDELKLNGNKQFVTCVVPIVAAVALQAQYEKAGVSPSRGAHEKRAESIRSFRERFWELGCANAEEVDNLADVWVDTMQTRNTAAHRIEADDVIGVLPYCEHPLREVLERAFEFLWGRSASEWGDATSEQKSRIFHS